MAGIEVFQQLFAAAQTTIDNIRQDIIDIKNSIPSGETGLTAEETEQVRADLQSLVDRLSALDLENPVTP